MGNPTDTQSPPPPTTSTKPCPPHTSPPPPPPTTATTDAHQAVPDEDSHQASTPATDEEAMPNQDPYTYTHQDPYTAADYQDPPQPTAVDHSNVVAALAAAQYAFDNLRTTIDALDHAFDLLWTAFDRVHHADVEHDSGGGAGEPRDATGEHG